MGVSMGHLHLNSADPDAQRKFWVETLGARAAKLGPADVYAIPGVLVMVTKKPQTPAGTEGSVVNHLGVKVKDFDGAARQVEGRRIQIHQPSATSQIIVNGPEGVRVELTKDAEMATPVMNHHVHFSTPDVLAMQKWYADTFGAIPGKRGKFDAADLPGVNLSFTKTETRMAGTKGRVARSHRLRSAKSGGLHPQAGKQRRQDGYGLSQDSRARHRHRVLHRPLGHLHRIDRRPGPGPLTCSPGAASFCVALALFALSGCAALIYEIVWLQLLELVIGSTAVSMAVLLGTYMGGMCLGSLALAAPRFRRGGIRCASTRRSKLGIGIVRHRRCCSGCRSSIGSTSPRSATDCRPSCCAASSARSACCPRPC